MRSEVVQDAPLAQGLGEVAPVGGGLQRPDRQMRHRAERRSSAAQFPPGGGVQQVLATAHLRSARRSRRRDQPVGALEGGGQRLLDEDVRAGRDPAEREGLVLWRWRGDDQEVCTRWQRVGGHPPGVELAGQVTCRASAA